MTRQALMTGNDDVIKGLYGKMGKASGWERDDWVEMVKSLKDSGLGHIGGDMAYLDRMSTKGAKSSRLSESIVGKVAATSKKPFEEGELGQRIVSYAAAWTEFKTANPGKPVDRFAKARILQRAKDMTFNMSRDSNSRWQKGNLSVLTQFWSYQARIAETLWDGGLFKDGKKLTRAEKLRLMGTMSTLYGAGTSASMVGVFIPTTEIIKEWMLEEDVNYAENPMMKAFIDGAPSALAKAVLGADVDFSSFAPGGLPTIVDLMNTDKDWADSMLGAGPNVLVDTGASIGALASTMGYSGLDLTSNDLLAVARNIATVDNVTKAMVAMNTGKYISKRGNYISDVTTTEALMTAVLGVNPMSVTDTYIQMAANKEYKNERQAYLRKYEEYARKSARALEAGDLEDYETYQKQMSGIGIAFDILPSERASIGKKVLFDTSLSQKMAEDAEKLKTKYETFSKDK